MNETPGHAELGETMRFSTNCCNCQMPAEQVMYITTIPHFKEVILMSMNCDHCGYRTSEVKGGGGPISDCGCRITLRVETAEDLDREVLKSDTAGISIPELTLDLMEGGMTGRYTTVEGLLRIIHEQLDMVNPYRVDNASESTRKQRFQSVLQQLKLFSEGKRFPFTLVITDSSANSFVGRRPQDIPLPQGTQVQDGYPLAAFDDLSTDANIKVEQFQRSKEQKDILSLREMNLGRTGHVQESHQGKSSSEAKCKPHAGGHEGCN